MAVALDNTPRHLRGNGRPVTEELTISDLKVNGSIPPELDGRYLRNGANPLSGTSDHPFFGDGMIHGVRVRDGKAEWYRNRYVQTPFIENASVDILDPAVMLDMKSSKANTHVIGHAGKILALEEGHFPYRAGRRARDRGTDRLRGRPHRLVHGAPQDLSGHRRVARVRLFGLRTLSALPARVRGRRTGPDREHHRGRAHDDARLQRHAEPRHLHGPAGRLRCRDGRQGRDADPLG